MNKPLHEMIVLGDEYDIELRKTVLDVLREFGATQSGSSQGVAGSQEVQTVSAKIGAKFVQVESETYVGLSISGDPILVHEIAARVRKRISSKMK